jgi:hypothetical protein
VTTTQVGYGVNIPKPFCTDPNAPEYVRLAGGPLLFTLSVSTGPSGRYERTYTVGAPLQVIPLVPAGDPLTASVFEVHQATMDNRSEQVTERVQQSLLGDPFQSMAWSFAAGATDRYYKNVVCGTE